MLCFLSSLSHCIHILWAFVYLNKTHLWSWESDHFQGTNFRPLEVCDLLWRFPTHIKHYYYFFFLQQLLFPLSLAGFLGFMQSASFQKILEKALFLLEAIEIKARRFEQSAMTDGHYIMRKSGGGGRSRRNEDLEEEDVWGVLNEREDSSPKLRKSKDYSSTSSSSSSAWRFSTAPRLIPRANNPSISHETKVFQQSSAPMNIPDWPKIYGKVSKKGSRDGLWVDNNYEDGKGDSFVNVDGNNNNYEISGDDGYGNDDDEDEDDDEEMVPPHEWIARKLARSQITSFSVCEGIGRTLKGRDLSKVRNAILTKTGFLE